MRTINVLFGFNHDVTSRAITAYLESYDCKVNASFRFTKVTIREFIDKNSCLDIIFLKEYLDGGEKYSALEISGLADTCRAKFVAVMRSVNKGREAMKILYCAGILDCVFAEGRAAGDRKYYDEVSGEMVSGPQYYAYHVTDAVKLYGWYIALPSFALGFFIRRLVHNSASVRKLGLFLELWVPLIYVLIAYVLSAVADRIT